MYGETSGIPREDNELVVAQWKTDNLMRTGVKTRGIYTAGAQVVDGLQVRRRSGSRPRKREQTRYTS